MSNTSSQNPLRNGHMIPNVSSGSAPSNTSQLLAQRKMFAESQIGRSSFQKLLEPMPPKRPGIAPYRIVLGNVKEKVLLTYSCFNYIKYAITSYMATFIFNILVLLVWDFFSGTCMPMSDGPF